MSTTLSVPWHGCVARRTPPATTAPTSTACWSSGKLVDDGICCSCHGSVFDLETGEPIYPPATEPIAVYPVREKDGEVFVGVSKADIADGGPRRRKLRRD